MKDNYILQCRNLSKRFGSRQALESINMDIPRGRIIGLLGPNGSGKTTFMKLVNGLLTPNQGDISVGGYKPGPETKKIVSYLPDKDYLPGWMKISQLIGFYSDFYEDFNKDKASEMLSRLGIPENIRFKTLSKGNKEKVQLILAMSREAELYMLDEPIGGVDPAARDYILETIINNYNENGTVIISTHLIADVEKVLDDVIIIRNGHILDCTSVDEIRESKGCSVDEYFREVFRC